MLKQFVEHLIHKLSAPDCTTTLEKIACLAYRAIVWYFIYLGFAQYMKFQKFLVATAAAQAVNKIVAGQ